jgi:hypothetical protein
MIMSLALPINTLLCIGAIIILPLTVGLIILLRYISYRETLALAEKGISRPERNRDGKDALRWGIVITAVGVALCLGLYPLGVNFGDIYPYGLGPWMLLGFVPLFVGLALILIYVLTRDNGS